ncbi:MAG: hypothetical protein M1831_007148 [Alyxoria varia]|nr:MAG: hypothetical protein M1831_007148 [Alyxoria varia]
MDNPQYSALGASCARWAVFTHYDFEELAPYIATPLITTTILEPSLYLLVACLPAMYPLISALTPHWLRRHLNSGIEHARQKRGSGHYQHTHGRGGTAIRIKGGGGMPGYAGGTGPHDAFARLDDGGVAHVFSSRAGAKGGRDVAVISPFADRELGPSREEAGSRSGNRSRGSEGGGGGGSGGATEEVDTATGLEMEDLRRLRLGEGIVVQTEIEVTASERVERIVGF